VEVQLLGLNPERKAQLEEYAGRRGQDAASALDDALAEYLAWERQEYGDAIEAIHRGCEDVRAGRTRPAPALHT